jgi:hypothetical protein
LQTEGAPGETRHIVIDHGGNVPYWEVPSSGYSTCEYFLPIRSFIHTPHIETLICLYRVWNLSHFALNCLQANLSPLSPYCCCYCSNSWMMIAIW